MAVVINGNGTVTGLAVGGLPDGIVDAGTLATNSVDSAELIDGAVDDSHMASISGRKNLIINGGFNVSQRGDYTTATTAADNVYYLDRFKAATNGASATVQHINNTTYNSLKMTATSTASGTLGAISFLEEFQKGKTLTASVRMKSNNSNARVLIYDGVSFLATSSTHTGDGSEEIITATGVVSTSATLLRVYTTISTAGVGAVSITSGDYIEIAEVQLELGSTATEFEHRSYGEELALCQRYYQRLGEQETNSTGNYVNFACSRWNSSKLFTTLFTGVPMRATPSLTGSGTGMAVAGGGGSEDLSISTSDFSIAGSTPHGVVVSFTVSFTPSNSQAYTMYINDDNYLELDSEL